MISLVKALRTLQPALQGSYHFSFETLIIMSTKNTTSIYSSNFVLYFLLPTVSHTNCLPPLFSASKCLFLTLSFSVHLALFLLSSGFLRCMCISSASLFSLPASLKCSSIPLKFEIIFHLCIYMPLSYLILYVPNASSTAD